MVENDSASEVYFDYVSAEVLGEICSKTGRVRTDDASLSENVSPFFKKFNFTDIILFQKAGKTEQNEGEGICSSLFETGRPVSGRPVHGRPVRYHKGIEIEADNENTLYSLIRKERPDADFLTVRSSDEKIIRAAAESPDVDAVIPVSNNSQKPVAGPINHIVAKFAAGRKTAFAFDMAPFLFVKGYRRSKLFADAAEMILVLRKYNVPILLFSGAGSFFEQRGPYELEAFGRLLGLTREETTAAVSTIPAGILRMRQKQKSGIQIMAGVEVLNENDFE
ncbi:MAG: hypothetical protein FWE78_05805 [Methanimicrococcus sp.]|nr:hypothetical protein [Methanimicrococcus sp.]